MDLPVSVYLSTVWEVVTIGGWFYLNPEYHIIHLTLEAGDISKLQVFSQEKTIKTLIT